MIDVFMYVVKGTLDYSEGMRRCSTLQTHHCAAWGGIIMTWHRYGRYAYRSVRTEHGVASQYVGALHQPEVAAMLALEAQEQAQAAQLTNAWEEDCARMAADEATIAQLGRAIETLRRAYLSSAGYHQHDRGPWRKRRA